MNHLALSCLLYLVLLFFSAALNKNLGAASTLIRRSTFSDPVKSFKTKFCSSYRLISYRLSFALFSVYSTMAKRVKKRTHAKAQSMSAQAKSTASTGGRNPKSMVIRVGASQVGSSVSQLVKDVRHMMEPDTAVRLKVS